MIFEIFSSPTDTLCQLQMVPLMYYNYIQSQASDFSIWNVQKFVQQNLFISWRYFQNPWRPFEPSRWRYIQSAVSAARYVICTM